MLREVEKAGKSTGVPGLKICRDDFLPAGGIGEEPGGEQIFHRNKVCILQFPIELTLVNVSIERQVQPRPMKMAADHGNHRAKFAEPFHLTLLVVAPSSFGQTSPQVVRHLFLREFIAVGSARIEVQFANLLCPLPQASRSLYIRTN